LRLDKFIIVVVLTTYVRLPGKAKLWHGYRDQQFTRPPASGRGKAPQKCIKPSRARHPGATRLLRYAAVYDKFDT
jgi:hypothetical protein